MLLLIALTVQLIIARDGYPPLSDLDRFPPKWLVEEQCTFLSARHQWIEGQQRIYGESRYIDYWSRCEKDNSSRNYAWQCLLRAEDYKAREFDTLSRGQLDLLRDAIGKDLYDFGVMPGPMDAEFMWR